MHAYCLFCRTERCSDIAALIQKTMVVRCISPRIIQRKWVKGRALEVSHAWLPGYLFLYTDAPVLPRPAVDGVIRVLGGGELTGEDRAFADMLYRQNGVMGTIRLAEEGDRCVICDPLWQGLRGTILKIDRGRKRCLVEFEFDKVTRSIWVGYDMVKSEAIEDRHI